MENIRLELCDYSCVEKNDDNNQYLQQFGSQENIEFLRGLGYFDDLDLEEHMDNLKIEAEERRRIQGCSLTMGQWAQISKKFNKKNSRNAIQLGDDFIFDSRMRRKDYLIWLKQQEEQDAAEEAEAAADAAAYAAAAQWPLGARPKQPQQKKTSKNKKHKKF